MNYNAILKKYPLSPGVYVISGPQGSGKTSLATALLSTDYKRWRKWRNERGVELAKRYFYSTGIRLDVSDTLYFSSVKICLDKHNGVYTHDIDIQRFGLPNEDYAVQYLPRGSVVFIQEADVQLFNRDWLTLPRYIVNLLKYCRHNFITVIFDCQAFGALDAAVRRLATDLIYVTGSEDKRYWFFWKRRVWSFIYTKPQVNAFLKELSALGKAPKERAAENGKFKFSCDVFSRYNSFSGLPYFLYGIENVGYEYKSYVENDLSIAGITNFVAAHPLKRDNEMDGKRRN